MFVIILSILILDIIPIISFRRIIIIYNLFHWLNGNMTRRMISVFEMFIKKISNFAIRQINPTELLLNKAKYSDTEAPFFYLDLTITNDIVSSKIYDEKQKTICFEIIDFSFLDRDVPHSSYYCIYISQLNRFARVCSSVSDLIGS